MSETFIKIDSLQHLDLSYESVKNQRYNIHCFDRTIHIFMTSTFQCEYCQCFTFKRCDKFKLKCASHGGMYSAHMILNSILTLLLLVNNLSRL